eukprot:9127642-Pyramimonas_sp.AAC.1
MRRPCRRCPAGRQRAVKGMATGAPALRGTAPRDPTHRFIYSDPPAGHDGVLMCTLQTIV